jgi:hypothetical protein
MVDETGIDVQDAEKFSEQSLTFAIIAYHHISTDHACLLLRLGPRAL